jgi:diguanylate cyclase (GGDEF)-like protein/PAS domain S-box-containing protein
MGDARSRRGREARLDLAIEDGQAFEHLPRLVARLLDAPAAAVSFLVDDQLQVVGAVGPEIRPWPADPALSAYVVQSGAPLILEDARDHAELSEHTAVRDHGARGYCGVPVPGPAGRAVGAVCAVDLRPRSWAADDVALLEELARSVSAELQLRAAARELDRERRHAERLARVVSGARDPVVLVDQQGICIGWNHGAERLYGWTPEDVLGTQLERLRVGDQAGSLPGGMDRLLAGQRVTLEGLPRRCRDGRIVLVDIDAAPLHDEHGEVVGATSIGRDVTERRLLEQELARSELRHRVLVSSLPDTMVVLYDTDLRCTLLQGPLVTSLGIDAVDYIEQPIDHFLTPEQVERLKPALRRALAGEQLELEYPGEDGRDYVVEVAPYCESDQEISGAFTVWRDVTVRRERERERERTELALREAEAQLRVTVEHAPIGVALVDLQDGARGHLLSANPAFARLIGDEYPIEYGLSLSSLVHPEDVGSLERDLRLLATTGTARIELEVRCLHGNGRIVWLLLAGAKLPGAAGTCRAVIHATDIEERKRFEGQLQYLADHDALTGLYNRRRFEIELERAVAHAERYGDHASVLLIDLDGFKYVNDTMGHSRGDELVTRVGELLRAALRETDVVARLGGDEFAVIVSRADAREGRVVARKVLEALRERAVILGEDRHARVTASIGLTTFAGGSGLTAEELLVEADIAMYQAKEAGKNQVSAYERAADHRYRLSLRHSWLERLRAAVEEERFELLAQPIRGLCAADTERYELLLRMRGDDGELVPPGTFLPNAERFGLIGRIDRWVFAQALKLLQRHSEAGHDVSLSINMSGKTLVEPDLLEDLQQMIAACPVLPRRLVVEVTETAAIVNIDKARRVARTLRELGCEFALDDFGAGFASFYYLKHLDFDYLKIDGEFIRTLSVNRTDELVVKSVVEIARGLGARTIAEFVGDDETVERLRRLGVDYGQGYHLGRPAPLEQVLPALRSGGLLG